MENKAPIVASGEKDSFIICRNSQGVEVRATPLRMSRFLVVFEVYNPYSILQLSEVLGDFRIIINDRLVYSGRAVVSNLVNTGIILVCEATLGEFWLDVDIFSPINQKDKLHAEFCLFLKEWQKIYKVLPEFKVVVSDLQTLLVDMRRWLEQLELGIRSTPSGDRLQIEKDVLFELREPILPTIDSLYGRFESIAEKIDPELQPVHRTYVKRQLHPLVLCSPFAYRTYQKPLGYAGDYEMVNMILRDPYEGSSLFAKMVNLWFLNQAPAAAHRNRIKYLTDRLVEETTRKTQQGKPIRILNLGCGPAMEIQRFMSEYPISDKANFTLLDFNDETLLHTRNLLTEFKNRYKRETSLQLVKKSVHQILKEALKLESDGAAKFDMVYCAGLFDYLSDRICKRLMNIFYELLAPGGLLVATNVDASNPNRHTMEYVLEWHLIYRNSVQLKSLYPDGAPPETVQVRSDTTGVNIYIEVRKAESA